MSIQRPLLLLALAAAPVLMVSCETTGDPTTGGIFWSEHKAQTRQAELQSHLNEVRSDNDRQRERTAELEQRN